jgi:hypothetical protein
MYRHWNRESRHCRGAAALDFGTAIIGTIDTLTATLSNQGAGILLVSGLTLTGSTKFTLNATTPVPPFPNTAGAHTTHMGGMNGPDITDCFVCHATLNGTHLNGLASFASGVDTNGNANIDLDETDVCDVCHCPDGPFDGVAEATSNWASGTPVTYKGCHGTGSSTIAGVRAPPVAGDNVSWGFFASGHGRRPYGWVHGLP